MITHVQARISAAWSARLARAILLMVALLAWTGCAQTIQPTASPATEPTASPIPADPASWQPPFPQRLDGDLPTPTPRLERHVLSYSVSGLLISERLEVFETGVAYLTDYGRLVATMTLSKAEAADLTLLSMRAGFASADKYIEEDPPGMVVEMPDRYIGLPGGRMLSLRGEAGAPDPLLDLERRLIDLAQRVRGDGVQAPRRLLGYWIKTDDTSYQMEIDLAGTVFFGEIAAGVLPPAELEELLAEATPELIAGWERRYKGYERQRGRAERIVSIFYQPDSDEVREIRPTADLTLPPSLERLLAHLAEIYDRYHP
jgi:hypothetical protein